MALTKRKGSGKKIAALLTPSAYDVATEKNYEGAPTFIRSDEEGLLRVLTTGTFEPTFYADAKTLAKEAIAIFKDWADRDPEFLAKAIVYAREDGYMRLSPITASAVLSAQGKNDHPAKHLFRLVFPRVIRTPGDLQDFLTIIKTGGIRGMGQAVQKAAQSWLLDISEYHVIKYGSQNQSMSLRDMFRIVRPKPLGGRTHEMGAYVVKGTVAENLPQISGYERFKEIAKEDFPLAFQLILSARLPWEVITAHLPATTATWTAILPQLPYMALLRNLNNLVKYGVFDGESGEDRLRYATDTLTAPPRVHRGRQFPFAYYTAMKALASNATNENKHVVATLLSALDTAMDVAFANLPDFGDRVLIANDTSSSMWATPLSEHSKTYPGDIAGIFAAAIYKRAPYAQLVSFNDSVTERKIERERKLAHIAAAVNSGYHGGTNLSAPLEWAFAQLRTNPERVFDTAIFLTDSESWVDHLKAGYGSLDLIREYKARVNPKLNCFFIQLMPYKHAVVPPEEPGCYYLYGWSESALRFISGIVSGGKDQVQSVRGTDLQETVALVQSMSTEDEGRVAD